MKKFVLCVFILAAFGAAVFIIGWTQFKVRPGECGILVSKTGGTDMEPVVPGKFSWHWELLLPSNAELKVFTLKPVGTVRKISGSLPSSGGTDFPYSFEFSVALAVSPQAVVELVGNSRISDDSDFRKYLDTVADYAAQSAASYILDRAEGSSAFRAESVRPDDIIRHVRLPESYPGFEISAFAVISSRLPDYDAYRDSRKTERDARISQDKAETEAQATGDGAGAEETELPADDGGRREKRREKVEELLDSFPELRDLFTN